MKEDISQNILFVGGIHGVGKTVFCKSICQKYNLLHYSASELIKKIEDIEFPSNLHIPNIKKNQDLLIKAIEKYLDNRNTYLLDGHFCLLNKNGDISKVPLSTFEQISPIAILVLYDDPHNIILNLQKKGTEIGDVNMLQSFQEQELIYSQQIATKLNIPYIKANVKSDNELIEEYLYNINPIP